MRLRTLSLGSKRIIWGGILAFILVAEGNFYFGWHLFRTAGEVVMNGSLVAAALLYLVMGPSIAEIRAYREGRGRG